MISLSHKAYLKRFPSSHEFQTSTIFYIMEAIVMTSGSCLQWFKIVFQKESYGRILIDHKKRNWTTYEIKIEQSQ